MPKNLMIGLNGVHLAPVITHTASAYETGPAISLPWAGKIALTKKESKQDLYYDNALYMTVNDLKGYEVEMRLAQIDFETMVLLGLGTYDATTNTFNENMQLRNGEFSLRFVADTVDHYPFYICFRSVKITSISPDSYSTSQDNLTPNELIVTGSISNVMTQGLAYKSVMQALADGSNAAACAAFLTDEELFAA